MTPSWTRPRALRPGDLIGLAAPAGAVEAGDLGRGVAELESLGFRVRVSGGLLERTRFTAGPVSRRLEELRALFASPEVSGIVCARGGAGSAALLEGLDPDFLRSHHKALVGYSDVTFLHLALGRLGLVSFHGPMVARELARGAYDRASLLHALTGGGAPYASEPDDLVPLREGEAEGRLLGGCLSILAAAAGTPWAFRPDPAGTLLFLEDVDERPYRIDRMLFQLRASGAFEGVRGVVLGDLAGCSPRLDEGYGLEEVLGEALDGLGVPVALGLSSGHSRSPCVTLPLGARARLECGRDEARLEVLEPAVA
jgi:muramoyltetrapeptide carboxypeptidase